MTAQNKTTIKSYFETGDKPTQAQFANLVDSYLDAGTVSAGEYGVISAVSGSPIVVTGPAGTVLFSNGSAMPPSFQAIGGGGTVTSAGLTMPNIFAVAGSPITTTGQFVVTLSAQAEKQFFLSPASATGAPTFRPMLDSDLPNTAVSAGIYTAPTITINTKGRITSATNGSAGGSPVTNTTTSGTTTVFSPDFTTNFSYRFTFNGVSTASGSGTGITIEGSSNAGVGYDATTYQTKNVSGTTVTAVTTDIVGNASNAATLINGYVEVWQDSTTGLTSFIVALFNSGGEVRTGGGTMATSAAVNRIRFAWTGGQSFDAGSITMLDPKSR